MLNYWLRLAKQKLNLVSFILGLSLVFAYAPFSQWLVPFIILSLWLTLLNNQPKKIAAAAGFYFGLGWFGSGISWVFVSIDRFGGLPVLVSVLLMVLLCAYLAIYPALACYLSAKFSKSRNFSVWVFPSIWLLTEYLRGIILTGFPWLSIGYSQIDGPLASFAPIIGEIGITFFLLCFAAAFSQLLLTTKVRQNIIILLVLSCTVFVSDQFQWSTMTKQRVNVALVQGNIPQELKWAPEQALPSMKKYLHLAQQHFDADLIIWPESAIADIEPMALDFLSVVNDLAATNNTSIITGIINYNFDSKEYFNSLIVLGKQYKTDSSGSYFYNNANRYYKHHLLPIGEFVPFQEWLKPIAPLFNLPMSSFTRGNYVQPNLVANGYKILPLLCFEITFADQLKANFNSETQLLLTVSNDAWFGNSHGPHQHLEIARMRAKEFARPLLRGTNNGITAVIDANGELIKKVPQFEEQVLSADVPLVKGTTPFSKFGHWLAFLFAGILFIIQWLNIKKQDNSIL